MPAGRLAPLRQQIFLNASIPDLLNATEFKALASLRCAYSCIVTMHMFFHFDGRRNLFLLLIIPQFRCAAFGMEEICEIASCLAITVWAETEY
jgi:hypothetical protein